jgi:hypothetical protein
MAVIRFLSAAAQFRAAREVDSTYIEPYQAEARAGSGG